MVDEEQLKLQKELAIRFLQTRDVIDKATGITYLSDLMGFNNKLYINYTREEQQIIRTRYPDRVDRSKSDQLGTHLSMEALHAKADEYKEIAKALEAYAAQDSEKSADGSDGTLSTKGANKEKDSEV